MGMDKYQRFYYYHPLEGKLSDAALTGPSNSEAKDAFEDIRNWTNAPKMFTTTNGLYSFTIANLKALMTEDMKTQEQSIWDQYSEYHIHCEFTLHDILGKQVDPNYVSGAYAEAKAGTDETKQFAFNQARGYFVWVPFTLNNNLVLGATGSLSTALTPELVSYLEGVKRFSGKGFKIKFTPRVIAREMMYTAATDNGSNNWNNQNMPYVEKMGWIPTNNYESDELEDEPMTLFGGWLFAVGFLGDKWSYAYRGGFKVNFVYRHPLPAVILTPDEVNGVIKQVKKKPTLDPNAVYLDADAYKVFLAKRANSDPTDPQPHLLKHQHTEVVDDYVEQWDDDEQEEKQMEVDSNKIKKINESLKGIKIKNVVKRST